MLRTMKSIDCQGRYHVPSQRGRCIVNSWLLKPGFEMVFSNPLHKTSAVGRDTKALARQIMSTINLWRVKKSVQDYLQSILVSRRSINHCDMF
jgi:hypothetical protein